MEASREEAVHEPARFVRLAAVEALAEEPEAPPRLVLDDVVIARRLRLLPPPPFGCDALRPLRMGDAVRASAPAEASRRIVSKPKPGSIVPARRSNLRSKRRSM